MNEWMNKCVRLLQSKISINNIASYKLTNSGCKIIKKPVLNENIAHHRDKYINFF